MFQAEDTRFATEEEVDEITSGVKPGGVPPFGKSFGLEVVSDRTLYDNEKIISTLGVLFMSL
ncbi:MAG: hypothetical protein DLM55_03645 [Acidimicrobiales bacterium]|nr:MAG: hypothetical protein DLM55_03645 [Acidimicrobiales bacterium]